jgi:hypothetical protein
MRTAILIGLVLSFAAHAEAKEPPTVMTVSWIDSDGFFLDRILDPHFAEVPECFGVRLIHLKDEPRVMADVMLLAGYRDDPNSRKVNYQIGPSNLTSDDPKSVVRLACQAAKAKKN